VAQRHLTGLNAAQQAATSTVGLFPLVSGLPHMTGGQGVAGSNPVVPTVGESPVDLVGNTRSAGPSSLRDWIIC
jgi:hypothetical protein